MEIRKLETEEKQNTKKLYEEVFSEDSKSFVDYYYEENPEYYIMENYKEVFDSKTGNKAKDGE